MLDRFTRWLQARQRFEVPERRRSGFYGPGKMPKNWLPYYGSRRWRRKRSIQTMRMLRRHEVD